MSCISYQCYCAATALLNLWNLDVDTYNSEFKTLWVNRDTTQHFLKSETLGLIWKYPKKQTSILYIMIFIPESWHQACTWFFYYVIIKKFRQNITISSLSNMSTKKFNIDLEKNGPNSNSVGCTKIVTLKVSAQYLILVHHRILCILACLAYTII